MNFDFTDDQQAIKSTAREFLAARLKPEKLRQLAEAGEHDDALWSEMSELGWPGIFVGEEGAYWESPWTYRLLRSRANSIEGGTTEILKNIIAERVLGLPKLR